MTTAIARPRSLAARTGLSLLLAAAADFLLFDHPLGLSLAVFVVLVAVAAEISNVVPADQSALPALILAAGLAPLVENVSPLSIAVALFSLAAFALAQAGRLATLPLQIAEGLVVFLAVAPLRFAEDFVARRTAARRRPDRGGSLRTLVGWVMPAGLAFVFVALLGAANPVIDHWLALIDLQALLDLLEVRRVLFWVAVFLTVWPFLRARLPKWFGSLHRRARAFRRPASVSKTAPLAELLFGRTAILRALAIFNAIFAVQTLLDGLYLWGGVTLPDGLTYAAYAHRGAYPLVATALIAAAFVLLTMRPGSDVSADSTIRRLVYLWTGQNVVLVVSSILRLDLYVDAYSLTYWRVAAFVWMGLVAAGLLLIIVRIALDRSNAWLVNVNLAVLAMTLYACCFVDVAGLIADYNVDHSYEMTGQGYELDVRYVASLGPAALPAIDRLRARQIASREGPSALLLGERDRLARDHRSRLEDWRAWTFRGWRLARYLDAETSALASAGPDTSDPRQK